MSKAIVLAILLFWASVSSCVTLKPVYYDDDKKVSRAKIEEIHRLYNDRNFDSIYDLLTERIKKEVSREVFLESMHKLMESNGRFLEASEMDSQVVPSSSFREVRLKYSSKYEKGWCSEGFAIFVDGKNSIVDLFMINPVEGPVQPKR